MKYKSFAICILKNIAAALFTAAFLMPGGPYLFI